MFRQADAHILRRTHRSALALAEKVVARSLPTNDTLETVAVPDLVLPTPQPLVPELLKLGVHNQAATRISSVLLNTATLFKEYCEADFDRRRDALRNHPGVHFSLSSTYIAIYTRAIRDWTTYLLKDITPRVIRVHRYCQTCRGDPTFTDKPRRSFNQAAVPSLEQSFDLNAFPSRLEKFELASAWNMEYRQICVWFQNRRSRFRKEGKTLHQRETSSGPLDALEKTVVDALLPIEAEEESDHGHIEEKDDYGRLDPTAFKLSAPAHAFPSPYPPVCPYDPFPTRHSKGAFQTPWFRASIQASQSSSPAIDVDSLTTFFATLTIADEKGEASAPPASAPQPSSLLHYPRRDPKLGLCTSPVGAPRLTPLTKPRKPHRRLASSRMSLALDMIHKSGGPESAIVAYPCSHRHSAQSDSATSHGSVLLKREPKRMLPRRAPKYPSRNHQPYDPRTPRRRRLSSWTSSTSSTTSSSSRSESDESPLSTPPSNSVILPPLSFPLCMPEASDKCQPFEEPQPHLDSYGLAAPLTSSEVLTGM